MRNALAGHTNSFHTYGREEALAGIAAAGYRTVELTAVEGWTEHVDLDADTGELRARLDALRPRARRALRATPTSRRPDGLALRHQGGALVRRLRPPGHEHRDRRPSVEPGRERVGVPRQHRRRSPRPPTTPASTSRSRSTATSWRAARDTLPLLERIGHDAHQGRLRHRQLRVLRRRQGRRRPRRRSSRTSPTCTSRITAAARATGTSRRPATARSTSPACCACSRRGGYAGPLSVEIEFQGEPWPPLAEVDAVDGARLRAPERARPGMINVAIVGGGFMGQTHAGAWSALGRPRAGGRRLVALAGARRARRGALRGRGDRRPLRADRRGPDVDVVDICLPTPQHREAAERALRRRQARPAREADRAHARGRRGDHRRRRAAPAGCSSSGSCCASGPSTSSCARSSPSGELGRPLAASALRLSPPPAWNDWMIDPARSGGVCVDLMVHDFDARLGAARPPAPRVRARRSAAAPHGAAQHCHAIVEHEGGEATRRGRADAARVLPVLEQPARALRARRRGVPVQRGPGRRRRQHRRRRPGREPPARLSRPTVRCASSTSRAATPGPGRPPP